MGDGTSPIGLSDWIAERLAEIDCMADASEKVEALVELTSELLPSPLDVFHQALAAANAITNNSVKARVLSTISSRLTATEQHDALEKALVAANAIPDDSAKASALSAIALFLPETDKDLLEQALTTTNAIANDSDKASALSAIAPRLPTANTNLLRQALTVTNTITNDSAKASVLSEIASRLPKANTNLLRQALIAANAITDESAKVRALSAIASRLPKIEQHGVLEQAFTAANAITDDSVKASVLSTIALQIPESNKDLLEQALAAANTITGALAKASALSAIVSRLSTTNKDLLEQALDAANTITSDPAKVKVLIAIVSRSSATDKNLLKQALTAANTIIDDTEKVKVLSAIVPRLPTANKGLLEQALSDVYTIKDNSAKARALGAIVPCIEVKRHEVLEDALVAANAIRDNFAKANTLSAIAHCLPETEQHDVLEKAITAANAIADDSDKASVLSEIALRLSNTDKDLLEPTLAAANAITNDFEKARTLSAIASRLPETEQHDVLDQALTIVSTITDDSDKANALRAIAPHLSIADKNLLEQALASANAITNDFDKARALSEIAPCLSISDKDLLEQALAAARAIADNSDKVRALSEIAPRLPKIEKDLLEQALAATRAIVDSFVKASVSSEVAPHLLTTDRDSLEQALITAKTIEDDFAKASALSEIALRLPKTDKDLLEKALTVAKAIKDDFAKASALSEIALRFPETDKDLLEQALNAAKTIKNDFAKASTLSKIAPRLPELKNALHAVVAITDDFYKSSALSTIAPRLPKTDKDLLKKALDAAVAITDAFSKASALSAIALRLSITEQQDVLRKAVNAVATITNDFDKANALGVIAPCLTEADKDLVKKTLDIAITITDDLAKARALSEVRILVSFSTLKSFLEATFSLPDADQSLSPLAVRLTEDFVSLCPSNKHSVALNIVRYIPGNADKVKFLSALIPRLSVGLLPNTLSFIEEIFTSDRYRTETLNNLIPYLPEDQFPGALRLIIQFIRNPHYKTLALESLIPLLPIQLLDQVLDLVENKILIPQKKATLLKTAAKALATQEKRARLDKTVEEILPDQAKSDFYKAHTWRIFGLARQLREQKSDDFSYERAASKIFKHLAPALQHLSEAEQLEFQGEVNRLEDHGYRAAVLVALVPYFKDFVRISLTSYTDYEYHSLLRIKIQLALIDSSNPQDLSLVLATLDSVKSPYRKAEAWVEIARHPAGVIHQENTLRAIRSLTRNAHLQTRYLQHLIPHLHYHQRVEAANVIGDIGNDNNRVAARVALARKFPESVFFDEACDTALALKSRVQRIKLLSTLAIDMPELLPRIIEIAEELDVEPKVGRNSNGNQDIQDKALPVKIERQGILIALAPHLPMRINREVNRECALGHFVSQELYHRALYLLARGYRDALHGGTLRNDAAQDRDLLDLKDEVNALSGLLLMRDLDPPMTVGILGGWGGGKSYIMHLMQAQMTAIRSRKVDVDVEAWNANPNHEKLSPYVGHIYQIKFDAWTFAKSDLWASLMQTIFTELDRQITLEQQLMSVLEKASEAQRQALEEKIWPVLYETNDSDRKWFLERVLNDSTLLDEFQSQLTNPELTGFLWKKFQTSQDAAISSFTQLQAELKKAESQLNTKKAEIREREHAQFRSVVELQNSKQAQRIDALLGTSLIVLRQRIGTPLFQRLNNEVYKELQGNAAAPDADAKNGLWKTLNETIQEYEQVSRGIVELEVKEVTDQNLDQLKEKSEELLQKIENTKFDIYTVAATVIDREYGRITLTSGWQWAQRNWVLISIFLLFFVVPVATLVVISSVPEFEIPVLQLAKDLMNRGDRSIAGLAAFLATLTPGIIAFQAMLKTAQKWFEETSLALQEYQKGVENRAKVLETTIEQKIATKIQTDAELQRLENTVKQLESQVRAKQAEMPENVYASLADFVSGRLQEGSYEKSLGLMQQVKQDLSALSDRLLPPRQSDQSWEAKLKFLKEVFSRGPARVVVYIDDLDRCPPDRVVQVLEAIQLLVKTPLFIAVLAIDERYITRALEQFYKGVLLRHGSPSGTDYLEKIIQLPYRVRPIMANSLETYLRSQVVIQDNATGGTKFSEFSRQEFNMLLACCKQVDLTPRTLKRLTNVYKLFKIVCRTRGNKPSVQVQQASLALLALSGRYPNLMRGIFEAIETCFEEQRDEAAAKAIDARAKANPQRPTLHLQSPLRAFLGNYQLPNHDRYLQLEFDKLQHDALHPDILPSTLTLEAMTHEIFNLIRSFSFVGEIGEDPDDHRRSGLVEQV